jgi:hypothetical protein
MNEPNPIYVNDPDALVSAATLGDLEVIEQLIENGADPDQKCKFGDTAIIAAVNGGVGAEAIIEYLLDHGADIDAEDTDGDTALDLAKYHGCDSMITFLNSRGATGADGPSAKQRIEDIVDDEPRYLDDRMFVLEISRVTTWSMTSTNERQQWAVIERRNVFGYPPTRCKEFDRRDAAVAFLKELAPQTPRVSLDGESPSPLPSWDEFQSWVTSLGVARLQVDDPWDGVDRGLFETLRVLRRKMAEQLGVPTYIVFGDATLRDMARRRPSSLDGFLNVKGVGEKKRTDYGEAFLGCIVEYCSEHEVSIDVELSSTSSRKAATSRPRRGPSSGARRSFEFFESGHSIDQVVETMGRAKSTVNAYLRDYLAHATVEDPSVP